MEHEEKFLKHAKRVLDEAEKNLDVGALARLRASRRQAIDAGLRRPARARPGWLLPVGGFATAGIVLTVVGLLWFVAPDDKPFQQANVDDLELLTARDNPEFFADLEFYDWLENIGNGSSG